MRHVTEIRRVDGTRVKITAQLYIEISGGVKYSFSVFTRAPRKRTWVNAVNHDDYTWRRLSHAEREAEDTRLKLLHVTAEEVQQAYLNLWQSIRPNFQ